MITTVDQRGATAKLEPTLPAPENKLFYPAVDGLRAVAVVMVFFFHYNAGLGWVISSGWAGVDIFFVLSGFLITGILYDSRQDENRFRIFYARRMLRIFPLFYGVFAVLLLTTPLFQWDWHRSWLLWMTYIGGLPAQFGLVDHAPAQILISRAFGWQLELGHFWSLCVEEQFYLIWPLIVFMVKDRVKLRNLCLIFAIFVPMWRTALMLHDPAKYFGSTALYFGLPFRMDGLLLGAAVALTLRGPGEAALKRGAIWIVAGGAGLWVSGWVMSGTVLHQGWSWTPDTPWIAAVGYTVMDVIAAGVLLLTIQPQTRLFRWLSIRPLRKLGQISYGLYVFHQIPHKIYFEMAQRLMGRYTTYIGPVEAVIAAVCTFGLATLSFRFFETPFLRLKGRFVALKGKPEAGIVEGLPFTA